MSSQPPKGGLSLYANLLDPDSDSKSITRAPVVSQEALDTAKDHDGAKKPVDPALRFQPHPQIRRPQQKAQKPKIGFPKPPAPTVAKPAVNDNSATPAAPVANPAAAPAPAPQHKSKLADWAPTEEDEYMYGTGDKRARGGRKRKKKNREAIPTETDWDDIYDPSRPTNVEEYLRSDERISEVREWKDVLYRHRRRDEPSKDDFTDSEEDDRRPMNNQFAPPPSYSFAPPPPSPPRAAIPDDKCGDDAYARRLAMSQGLPAPPPQPASQSPPPPPPPPSTEPSHHAPPPVRGPNTGDSSSISRAPVRYTAPEPGPDAMEEDGDEGIPPAAPDNPGPTEDGGEEGGEGENTPRTNRPGQKGFAARLMSKYGWSKGQALGADGTGLLQPLRVQVEKRRKRPDAEGGGWAEPGGKGRIIGGKRGFDPSSTSNSNNNPNNNSPGNESAGTGTVSHVVVLRDMLEGLEDLQGEMEAGLAQEIGEECGDKYGRVERLYIDIEGRRVYIKFTDQVSALGAVDALQGRVFAGNTIRAQFYDVEKFEAMVYE